MSLFLVNLLLLEALMGDLKSEPYTGFTSFIFVCVCILVKEMAKLENTTLWKQMEERAKK